MAIRFVDVESGKGEDAEPAPARRPSAPARRPPEEAPEPAPTAAEPAPSWRAEGPGEDTALPGLPHAKPEPKARGRKKPLSATGSEKLKAAEAAPLLDGLLPELQAHAKPKPKPRGRKKAFG